MLLPRRDALLEELAPLEARRAELADVEMPRLLVARERLGRGVDGYRRALDDARARAEAEAESARRALAEEFAGLTKVRPRALAFFRASFLPCLYSAYE